MRKACWTVTTSLFFTLAVMLALVSPTSVRADDGDASSNPRESCSTSVGCKVDSAPAEALCEGATSVAPIKKCGNTNSLTEMPLRSGVVAPPQALRGCLPGDACAQLPPLQASGELPTRRELRHWLFDHGKGQQTGAAFARPWVVSNPMAEHCKKMAAAGGKNGEVLLEYCLAQAMGGPDATKARTCYQKHPGELADFKACLSDMKTSKPLSSPPRSQSTLPPGPDMNDIQARIARDNAARAALMDKMVEAGKKAAGTFSQEEVDTTTAIYEKVLGGLESASNFVQSGLYDGKAEKTLAHYGRLKHIDPEGAKEMLEAAVQGRVTSEWNKEVIAKGQTPGLLVAGAQQRIALEKEAKKNPDKTMVEYYKDHELPVYRKSIKDLINVPEEYRELIRKWGEYGNVQGALSMKNKGTEAFGPTARLLGLSEKEVLEIVRDEEKRFEKLQKNGEIARDVEVGSLAARSIEKILTERYLKDQSGNNARVFKEGRDNFSHSSSGEGSVLFFMEGREEAAKSGKTGNCDWVEEKYHVPNGTPLCHDNKVAPAAKN